MLTFKIADNANPVKEARDIGIALREEGYPLGLPFSLKQESLNGVIGYYHWIVTQYGARKPTEIEAYLFNK